MKRSSEEIWNELMKGSNNKNKSYVSKFNQVFVTVCFVQYCPDLRSAFPINYATNKYLFWKKI